MLQGWREDIRLRFGSRRNWCRHHLFATLEACGALRISRVVDWARVRRLLFVCKGNICRSAYAEWKARAAGLPAASFGLEARALARADVVAAAVAERRGVGLAHHRARPPGAIEIRPTDLVVAMEPRQAISMRRLVREAGAQVTLLGLFARQPRSYLPDPYGLGEAYFETCFGVIDEAIEAMARRMRAGDPAR